ncbi:2,3-diaminopropionate biosynthesis protein SbnB [Paenibacillus sp. YPG26]|uniref:2,3-diaminopropionate biosynthesis protein SbnB n=1 Tax=Paenibacillus sp. YPG26 TaxID=2878915 RepID=UPI00203A9BC8|nr:2,3-diaminopropionate biosynthesis protein SbnB [Paenibacillus sp. YPG26]USB33542.1 2,3-diaminopropionate biosynthesis protein SbnB [Paenibacillus sp. YPG26]
MRYLNDEHIQELGRDWIRLTDIIRQVITLQDAGETVRPLKPYLRFGDPANRIIAMPAYVGGDLQLAGIKWIASFPYNRKAGLPRAHNSIILNDTRTGKPRGFLRSSLLNGIRTAAVSGVMLQSYLEVRDPASVSVGIVGWGPVGRLHLEMSAALLGSRLKQVYLYDIEQVQLDTIPADLRSKVIIEQDWRQVYRKSDVFITCTVSDRRYIDERPREGSLLLHVSLRDYLPESIRHLKVLVVDDWQEVCRENTDIEQLHLQCGLQQRDTVSLAEVVLHGALGGHSEEEPVLFSPMGLGIFDLGIAGDYLEQAEERGLGTVLED